MLLGGVLGLALAALGGCATGGARAGSPHGPAAGRWEGFFQTRLTEGLGAGDTRIERQSCTLDQQGRTVTGTCIVELTMISGDGRPYVCSRNPHFSTLVRYELRGHAPSAREIDLEQVGPAMGTGPCQPSNRHVPARLRARIDGDVMTVLGAGRTQTLYRRGADSEDAFAAAPRVASAEVQPGPESANASDAPFDSSDELTESAGPPSDVHGFWVWQTRGVLPSGDEKQEREEWHLSQDGRRVSGYYDRAIRQVSTDGQAYRCSGALDFRITTRYEVAGEVRGDRVVLSEKSFEILEGSPCDDGRRRLDSYRGRVDANEIQLVLGSGRQVLHRARPDLPTQRF